MSAQAASMANPGTNPATRHHTPVAPNLTVTAAAFEPGEVWYEAA